MRFEIIQNGRVLPANMTMQIRLGDVLRVERTTPQGTKAAMFNCGRAWADLRVPNVRYTTTVRDQRSKGSIQKIRSGFVTFDRINEGIVGLADGVALR